MTSCINRCSFLDYFTGLIGKLVSILFPEMKEPENIDLSWKKSSQLDENTNFNNNNNKINDNSDSKYFEGKREEAKKEENFSGTGNGEAAGAGVYYVSIGRTTESFNFGNGRETHISEDEEDLVTIENYTEVNPTIIDSK